MTWKIAKRKPIIATLSVLFTTLVLIWLQGEAELTQAVTIQNPSQKNEVKYNRLINESSPYLLQHATNPVDWYPWGKDAFEKARKEDKPIFLSIGYSTCHWCHVMEHESFADEEVAALLNQYFVSVKVDREERPDIDQVYMAVTQTITGQGGWPNNVFLTPDKKPFFAGTYFPKQTRWGINGLMELLPKIAAIWQNDRENVLKSAEQITNLLVNRTTSSPGDAFDQSILDKARNQLADIYDPQYGGFGQAPKFPTPHILTFLLRRYHHNKDTQALAMVENTLTRMRLGGIHDHIGFGFHRYSTDGQWLVPHFEKMLYDQALLAMAYTEAYQATGKEFYARTVKEILTYILRDMTSNEGGFYSAEDADSEGVEGKFYLWTLPQIQKILGKKEAEIFKKIYNLETKGNFITPEATETAGSNILHLKNELPFIAGKLGVSEKQLQRRMEKNRETLFKERKKRVPPFKDDKILTDWNGLMIASLAKAGLVLEEPRYTSAAVRAADFLMLKLQDKNRRLVKRYRKGIGGLPAHLDDYAFVVWGFLELYEATLEVIYLQEAIRLNDQLLKHFWDQQGGGLFMTADDSEKLLIRNKKIFDGAIPSGNAVAALNLLRLGHMTGRENYLKKAEEISRAFSESVNRYPPGHAHLMMALDYALNPSYEVVIVGRPAAKDTRAMLTALRRPFLPNKVVLLRPADKKAAAEIIRMAPYTEFMVPKDGRATAYVCSNFVCKLPTTDISQMLANLQVKSD